MAHPRTTLLLLALVGALGCRQAPAKASRSEPISTAQQARFVALPVASTDTAAVSVTDDLGRTVTLAKPARRIACLSPSLTELLFAVGCGDTLVLRDAWSDFPPEALQVPAVKGLLPRAEAVLTRRPDLLLW